MSSMKIVFATVVSVGLGGGAAFMAMNHSGGECTSCTDNAPVVQEQSSCCATEAKTAPAAKVTAKPAAPKVEESCCSSESADKTAAKK